MQTVNRVIDVTGTPGLDGMAARLAVSIHLPDAPAPASALVFAVPGGGYSRGYFDMRFPGHEGYSQAEHHAARGIVTIAVDHLGVGESSAGDTGRIQFEHLALAYDACVRRVLDDLRAGSVEGVAPMTPSAIIGIGQSMGGCVSIVTQALHGTFDAIGVLGYSAIHTRLPQREIAQEVANAEAIEGITRGSTGRGARETVMQDHVYPFHFEDVPSDILAADMAGGYPIRTQCPPWGSATIPDCAVQMMLPGVVSNEAAAVRVPVFVGNGERDVCPDPRAEPGAYRASNDITTMIVPQMAHMHNFASSRDVLWDRLAGWYLDVAQRGRT